VSTRRDLTQTGKKAHLTVFKFTTDQVLGPALGRGWEKAGGFWCEKKGKSRKYSVDTNPALLAPEKGGSHQY